MRRLSRREFLVGTACAGTCAAGLVLGAAGYRATHDESQSNARVYRVGFVTGPPREPFRAALQQLGYVEGRNLLYEHREGLDAETSRAGAAELVAERVDVLVATGQLQVSGAVQATSEVPIVSMGLGGDLLAARLIDSLARPGGNLTGLTSIAAQLDTKRLQLLKEIAPSASLIAALGQPEPLRRIDSVLQPAARALGVLLHVAVIESADDIESSFEEMSREGVEALLLVGGTLTFVHRETIIGLAARYRLPAIYNRAEWVSGGGLAAYQPNELELQQRTAAYVDRILKGAKPADLPVEQPMTFDFVVNMRTARELGISFPHEVALQITEVIE